MRAGTEGGGGRPSAHRQACTRMRTLACRSAPAHGHAHLLVVLGAQFLRRLGHLKVILLLRLLSLHPAALMSPPRLHALPGTFAMRSLHALALSQAS